jgi:hypothetical protein
MGLVKIVGWQAKFWYDYLRSVVRDSVRRLIQKRGITWKIKRNSKRLFS